jgi:hypothetical protein
LAAGGRRGFAGRTSASVARVELIADEPPAKAFALISSGLFLSKQADGRAVAVTQNFFTYHMTELGFISGDEVLQTAALRLLS